MSTGHKTKLERGGEECIVCGKALAGGNGFHISYDGETVAVCASVCASAFRRTPGPYLHRRKFKEHLKA